MHPALPKVILKAKWRLRRHSNSSLEWKIPLALCLLLHLIPSGDLKLLITFWGICFNAVLYSLWIIEILITPMLISERARSEQLSKGFWRIVNSLVLVSFFNGWLLCQHAVLTCQLYNIMTKSSHCFCKCDRNSGSRSLHNGLPKSFGQLWCMSPTYHCWELIKSLGSLWQLVTPIHDEDDGLILCGRHSEG